MVAVWYVDSTEQGLPASGKMFPPILFATHFIDKHALCNGLAADLSGHDL